MAPSRALQLICRAAAAALLCAGQFQHLAEFQTAEAKTANPIQAPPVRFVLPHETPDAAETKNVCSQVRSPKRNLPQRPEAFRSAKCEMADDRPFLLLFRAIARGREVLPRAAPEASQIRGFAKIHPVFGHAPPPLARSRADRIAAANPGAYDDPSRLPTFWQVITDNPHR